MKRDYTMADLEAVKPEIFARIDQKGPEDCWEWTKYRDKKGYGSFSLGNSFRAHRLVLEIKVGHRLARDVMACHHCDNPPCCNPGHLFVGNASTNMIDCVSKGRHFLARKTHCIRGHLLPVERRPGAHARICGQCRGLYKKWARARRRAERAS